MIQQMTAREARNINPTSNDLYDTVELLIATGWKFKTDRNSSDWRGWWIHPTHETKNRPVGDPRPFYESAWMTFRTYVAPEVN